MAAEQDLGEYRVLPAVGTRVLEIEIDSRLHEELVVLGEQEGFDAGAELVAMALRELLRRWCSPEQSAVYSAILHAMHEQALALQLASDVYGGEET